MGITLEMQIEFFVWSVITGLFSGFIYDFFRTVRVMAKPKNSTIIVHDILFLVILALGAFVLSFTVGRGELRLFEFIGIFCGFILYRWMFKDSVIKILIRTVKSLIKISIFVIKIVIFPLKIIYKILEKPFNIIIWHTRRKRQKAGLAFKIKRERVSRSVKNFLLAVRKK